MPCRFPAVGIRILARAIEEPLRQIVENAGEDAAVVLNAVKAGAGEYGDMLEEGILASGIEILDESS